MMTCPQCQNSRVGRLSIDRYFCPDCCVEFAPTPSGVHAFRVLESGDLDRVAIPEQPITSGEDG